MMEPLWHNRTFVFVVVLCVGYAYTPFYDYPCPFRRHFTVLLILIRFLLTVPLYLGPACGQTHRKHLSEECAALPGPV